MLPRVSGLVLVLIIGGDWGGARRYLVILTKVRTQGYGRYRSWLWVLTFVRMTEVVFSCERRNPGLHSATFLTLGSCVRRRTGFYRKGAALC
jgi:hypothetical protein